MDTLEISRAKTQFELIGQGSCGTSTVWVAPEFLRGKWSVTWQCMKRQESGRCLETEYRVQTHLNSKREGLFIYGYPSIPRCTRFVDAEVASWNEFLPCFPRLLQAHAHSAIFSQLIPSIAAKGRKEIVKRYCPPETQDLMAGNVENRHCLLHAYLGRRRQSSPVVQRQSDFFTLRDFKLHVDQMGELGLPVEQYAETVAKGLAFLHWAASVDGNGVEFVLASCPPTTELRLDSKHLGHHWMWMLDFDRCHFVDSNENGVEEMVKAFWRNDSYFPQPWGGEKEDSRLWDIFASEYKDAAYRSLLLKSCEISDKEVFRLRRLVDKVLDRITGGKDATPHGA